MLWFFIQETVRAVRFAAAVNRSFVDNLPTVMQAVYHATEAVRFATDTTETVLTDARRQTLDEGRKNDAR